MTQPSADDISQLLRAWSEGDESALDVLVPLVYDELHRLAHHYMRHEGRGHLLQTTAVIHETFLRLVRSRPADLQDRAHFFAICSRLMRQILVDFARGRRSQKRAGETIRLESNELKQPAAKQDVDLVALDDALTALSRMDVRKARVVELRFFGGLSVEETAEVLEVSPETVTRDWRLARAWLLKEISDGR
jgi:RNA polymerase sigma-70 factor (ECF subfamily)